MNGKPVLADAREQGGAVSPDDPREGTARETEARLIERAKKGDRRAFEELVRGKRPMVISRLRSLCSNEADVEDLFQEISLKLYLKLSLFEGRSSLSTWLYRVTTNAFLMHRRKNTRRGFLFVPITSCDEALLRDHADDRDETPREFSHVLSGEAGPLIREAMSKLPAGHEQVVLLREMKGLSLKEVSGLMKISVPSIKSRQHRSRKQMRASLTGLGVRRQDWGLA